MKRPAASAAALARLDDLARAKVLARLPEEEADELDADWPFWARAEQLAPEGEWRVWLLMAGRGFGKTRAGAEWVRAQAEADGSARIALVGATLAEARGVMVEGDSGLLAIAPTAKRPRFEPSRRRLACRGGGSASARGRSSPCPARRGRGG